MYLLSFFLLVLRKWLKGRWRFGVQREVVHGAAALALTVAAGATDIVVRRSGLTSEAVWRLKQSEDLHSK